MGLRLFLLALHDMILHVRRREVYRYSHGGEWRFMGLEADDWFARLMVGRAK